MKKGEGTIFIFHTDDGFPASKSTPQLSHYLTFFFLPAGKMNNRISNSTLTV
jgi:hypothetical protein